MKNLPAGTTVRINRRFTILDGLTGIVKRHRDVGSVDRLFTVETVVRGEKREEYLWDFEVVEYGLSIPATA